MVRRSASRIATTAALAGVLLAVNACGAKPEPTAVPEAPPPAAAAPLAGAAIPASPPAVAPAPVATAPVAPAAAAPAQPPAPAAPAAEAPPPPPPPPAVAEAPAPAAEAAVPPAAAPSVAAAVAADASRPHPALAAPGPRVAVPRGRLAPPPSRPAQAPPPAALAKPAAPVAAPDERAARLAALQRALAPMVRAGAVLRAPATFASGAPAEVSLTLPADLAAAVQSEAARAGLPQAGESVNLTARLAGAGYTVTPDQPQAQPLLAGQPARFVWKVAAAPDAKGPLSVAIGAQLLGAGADRLDLGSVAAPQAPGVFRASRLVGLVLLLALVAGAFAWLDRRRRRPPARPATTPLRRVA